MVAELTIHAGDYGKYLTFYLREPDGIEPFTLSGYSSIVFQAQRYGESTLTVNSTCDVVNANTGEVRYLIAQIDFLKASPPKLKAEIHAYFPTMRVTWEKIYITIEPDLPS